MHTIVRNSCAGARRSHLLTAAVTVAAALTSGGVLAVAAPAAYAAEAPAAPAATAQAPADCPSDGCHAVAESLTDPRAVALDGHGKAYIAGDDTLTEVDMATGKRGEVASGLGSAHGVALDGEGHAYVTSEDDQTLYRVDLSTGEKTKLPVYVKSPESVALDGKGNAVVTDYWNDDVWTVDLSSGEKTWLTDFPSPTGVALDGRGTAYVAAANEHKLYAVDLSSGHRSVVADDIGGAGGGKLHGVALSGGHAYVGQEDGRLWEVDLDSGDKRVVAKGEDFRGVAADQEGTPYAVDNRTQTLWRVGTGAPPTPPSGDTEVELRPVAGIEAVRGQSAVPRVNVTNTGGKRIGDQDITLKLGPEGVSWGYNVIYQDRDGKVVEAPCHVVDDDRNISVCENVHLDLDPGQSVELRTEVGTSESLKACDLPSVVWQIADKKAKTDWVMKNPDGSPDHC